MPEPTLRSLLARNLRRLRLKQYLTQAELAKLAGINRNYVGMIEREEHAVTLDVLEQLAAALDLPPIHLLRDEK